MDGWTNLPTGDRIWLAEVESPGAVSLGLVFSEFHMPEGATLYVYSADRKHVLGAYTASNNREHGRFAIQPLEADRIVLEYYEPARVRGKGRIALTKVAHGFKDLLGRDGARKGGGDPVATPEDFGDSASCHINVNCPEGNAWQDEKNAVVLILLSDLTRNCSGSLINNTAQDDTPYILTAAHCINTFRSSPLTQTEIDAAEDWIVWYQYESAACSPTTEPSYKPATYGTTLRAYNMDSDFALVEVNAMSPYAYPYYAGWSRINTPASSSTGIHHPRGDVRKIAVENHSAVSDSWQSQGFFSPPNSYWKVHFDMGTTERGASGSPLFDQNSRIVGQLSGNRDPLFIQNGNVCQSTFAWYGKLSTSWNHGTTSDTRLKDWLDPGNLGSTTLDGMYGPIPPDPPTNLTITNANQTNANPQLTWTASPSANVTHYEVYRCPSYYLNCFSYGSVIASPTGTSYTDFGIQIKSQSQATDRYSYKVRAVNTDNLSSNYSLFASIWGDPPFKGFEQTEEPDPTAGYRLEQNYPNPFNPSTEIPYYLDQSMHVSVVVYDASGREVARLVDGVRSAGRHAVSFDATLLPNGVYTYELRTALGNTSRQLILAK